MKEQYIRIQGPDHNGIYGKLSSVKSDTLIIHLHGMTHSMHTLLEVTSAPFFTNNGYDHYRISLYERMPDSRKLSTSSLSTHVRDIDSVLSHFRRAYPYKKIFLSAHSLSGLCTLILNPDVDAIRQQL